MVSHFIILLPSFDLIPTSATILEVVVVVVSEGLLS